MVQIGIKSTWFDNTLRFNGAYYDYTYDNLQELAFVEGACQGTEFGSNQFLTSDIEGSGYEISLNWLATTDLELWVHASAHVIRSIDGTEHDLGTVEHVETVQYEIGFFRRHGGHAQP